MFSLWTVPETTLLYKVALSLFLGAFLGIRREMLSLESKAHRSFMGFRTMTFISLMGTLSTLFPSLPQAPFVFFVGILGLIFMAYAYGSFRKGRNGITSECTAILMFWTGVLVGFGEFVLATILTIVLAYLNAFKYEIQGFIKTLTLSEWRGAFHLLVLSALVLPFLPTESVDPWGVIIPFNVWLLVMLISGIGFVGYFLVKYLGTNGGIPLTSFLGALVSSTAVTTSVSTQSRKYQFTNIFSVGILIALATMQFRVAGEIALLAPGSLRDKIIMVPIIMGLVSCLSAGYFWWKDTVAPERKKAVPQDIRSKLSSPFELKPALLFGIIFMVVLLAVALGKKYLGDHGVYGASVLSAIIDVDAIVLSSIEAVKLGEMPIMTAKNAIAIALIVNTFIKIVYVGLMGSRSLLVKVTPAVVVNGVIGALAVMLL